MKLSEMQKVIKEIYIHHDSKRGIHGTYKWLLSEVHELGDAISNNNINGVREEAADVLAWLLSLMNLVSINLEEVFLDKYGDKCPRCGSKPCTCPYREGPKNQ